MIPLMLCKVGLEKKREGSKFAKKIPVDHDMIDE